MTTEIRDRGQNERYRTCVSLSSTHSRSFAAIIKGTIPNGGGAPEISRRPFRQEEAVRAHPIRVGYATPQGDESR